MFVDGEPVRVGAPDIDDIRAEVGVAGKRDVELDLLSGGRK